MSNVQISSQYTHVPDSLSLDGLDDFLCGLIDELFHVEGEVFLEDAGRQELAQIEQDIINEIDNGGSRDNVRELFSEASPRIFSRSPGVVAAPNQRPSIFGPDNELVGGLELKVRLLESQLDYRNGELKESLRRMKWLENELASREDQLKFLPELLKRSVDATKYEFELDDLKLKLEFLSSELATARAELEIIKSNWLGRLSLWLASKKAEMERTEPPLAEASD